MSNLVYILDVICAEIEAEIKFRGVVGYKIDRKHGKVTFRKPYTEDELHSVLRASEFCIRNGLTVTIK